MDPFLQGFLRFIVPFFAVVSMVGAGLGRSVREVTRPLRRPAFLISAILANFVVVPLLGYAIARMLALDEPYAIGLFLASTAAGSAFLVALVRTAKTDLPLATGLLVCLLVVTIFYMPLVIPLVLPWATVSAMDIGAPLLLTMFLPLVVGMAVHRKAPHLTGQLRPLFGRASQISLILLIATTFVLHLPSITKMVGSGALAAAFLLTLGSVVVGLTMGGTKPAHRAVLALGTGQRNIAAAAIVAAHAFDQPEPLVMVVVTSLVAFLVLFPAAFLLKKRHGEEPPVDRFVSSHREPLTR